MAVRKEILHNLIDQLNEADRKTVLDFMLYLIDRSEKKPEFWKAVDASEPDDIPLNREEKEQLESEEGYITGEDAKREFGLQVDLP
jgi:hypothetical protein